MTKPTDITKIERIREASVRIIGKHGIMGSSVAVIASEAGVSVGYLYRHYPSKEELINDLLKEALFVITDKIDSLIESGCRVDEVVRGVVRFILETAFEDSDKIRFIIVMLNDFSVDVHADTRRKIESIGKRLIEAGNLQGVLTTDDLYVAMVGIPIQYISARYKFGFEDGCSTPEEMIGRVSEQSVSLIKQKTK